MHAVVYENEQIRNDFVRLTGAENLALPKMMEAARVCVAGLEESLQMIESERTNENENENENDVFAQLEAVRKECELCNVLLKDSEEAADEIKRGGAAGRKINQFLGSVLTQVYSLVHQQEENPVLKKTQRNYCGRVKSLDVVLTEVGGVLMKLINKTVGNGELKVGLEGVKRELEKKAGVAQVYDVFTTQEYSHGLQGEQI